MKTTIAELNRRITRGVKLLDRKLGKQWPEKIDLGKLEMSYSCDCVLGQCSGQYNKGLKQLGIQSFSPEANKYAFYHPDSKMILGCNIYFKENKLWATLTRLWRSRIKVLKKERGLK